MNKSKRTYGHGHIFKRNGNFYIQCRDHRGKLVQRALIDPETDKRAETKSHADRIAPVITRAIRNNEEPQLKRKKIAVTPLSSVWEAFLNDDENQINPTSSKNRETAINRFMKDFPIVEDITKESIQEWRRKRLKEPKQRPIENPKPRTVANVNREVSFLKRLLSWAAENGKINSNPLVSLKPIKEDNRRERILTREERTRLLHALREKRFSDIRLIVLIAMYTGMRRGEILSMKWENVDHENHLFHLLETKTGEPRKVPIPSFIEKELQELNQNSVWVFPSPKNPENHVGDLKHSFTSLLKAAEIENFKFHDLRHVAATLMVEKGVHPRTIMSIFGWSTLKMIERYTSPDDEIKHQAVNSIADEYEADSEAEDKGQEGDQENDK